MQLSLNYDKNNKHFVWRPKYAYNTSTRQILHKMKNVSDEHLREIMGENMVEPDGPQVMT